MAKRTEKTGLAEEYEEVRPQYEVFTNKVEKLVKELIEESHLAIHSVSSRTKTVERYAEKVHLDRDRKKYREISDVTDISGVRVICYFSDQVDSVAQIIEQNFDVAHELSVDKRETMGTDRFGYLSLHYVVRLSHERASLLEYQRYGDMLCELQIRSILQHAWAEIEHDLGYKASVQIPKDLRRRFSILAGQLEAADEEFVRVRKEIDEYESNIVEQIKRTPNRVLIDKVSLIAYAESSSIVREIDGMIADSRKAGVVKDDLDHIGEYVEPLSRVGIHRISELDTALQEHKTNIVAFADMWLGSFYEDLEPGIGGLDFIHIGLSIYYLGFVLSFRADDPGNLVEYLREVLKDTPVVELDALAMEAFSILTRMELGGSAEDRDANAS